MRSVLAPNPRNILAAESELLFHWTADRLSLVAVSGQAPADLAFVNATNLIGNDAATLATQTGQPAWQIAELDAAVSGRETPTLMFGTGDTIGYTLPVKLRGCCFLAHFIQPSSMPVAGKGLLYLGTDAVSGSRAYFDSTGSFWRMTYHNGTTSVTSTLAAVGASGDQIVLFGVLGEDGKVQLFQYNLTTGVVSTATQSGALALVALSAGAKIRLNGIGTANTCNGIAYRTAKLGDGAIWTEADLFARY